MPTHLIFKTSKSRSVVSNSLRPHRLHSPWNFPGQSTRVGSLSLLQGIFPNQGSNPGLLHYRQILYQLNHKVSPRILEWAAYPFSSVTSWPRNKTGVSCIAGRFFTNWAIKEALIILNLRTNMKATKICYLFIYFLVSLPSFDVCTLKARSPLLLPFLNCMTRTFWSNDILPPNHLEIYIFTWFLLARFV